MCCREIENKKKMRTVHNNVNTKELSEANQEKLRRINRFDYALYDFVLRTLLEKAETCNIDVSQPR